MLFDTVQHLFNIVQHLFSVIQCECWIVLNEHQIVLNECQISVERYLMSFNTTQHLVWFDSNDVWPARRSERQIAPNERRMTSNGVEHGDPR